MLRYAEWYFKYGWKVIPSREKKALVSGWGRGGTLVVDDKFIKDNWKGDTPDPSISVICGKKSGIMVIDTDNEEKDAQIEDLLPPGFVCPTAVTPRGGKHRYFAYQGGLTNWTSEDDALSIKTNYGLVVAPPSENSNGAYTWEKGKKVGPKLKPPPMPSQLYDFLIDISKRSQVALGATALTNQIVNFDGARNESMYHLLMCLHRGGMSVENINIISNYIYGHLPQDKDHPYTKKELQASISSVISREYDDDRNVAFEVREWVGGHKGHITTTDCHRELVLGTKEHKKAANMELLRLKERGILRATGRRAGSYRIIDAECPEVEYRHTEYPDPLSIKWPFEIEELVNIYPGNIVVIAGEKDSGKTGFLLNFLKLNHESLPLRYFSSEMGWEELNIRLQEFDDIDIMDWKFKFHEKSDNFSDVIYPDEINVIDFLEVYKDFSEIAGTLREIWEQLDKGIAIIAIQKLPGQDIGRGGWFSAEKARLYLSLSYKYPNHTCKIVVGKNPAQRGKSVKGLSVDYRLADGCHLSQKYEWRREWVKGGQ